MATHGLTGLRRSLVGSVAGRVLGHATMPLVLVRATAESVDTLPALEEPAPGTLPPAQGKVPGDTTTLADPGVLSAIR